MADTHHHIKTEMVHITGQNILYIVIIKVYDNLAVSVYAFVIKTALVFQV